MKISFVKKITSVITVFFILTMVLYTYFIVTTEHEMLLRNAIEEEKDINNILAITFEASEATTGIAYRSYLVERVSGLMDVAYFRMVKPTGEIYLSTDKDEWGDIVDDPLIFTKDTVVIDDIYNGENIKVVVSPASRGYTLWLGFSLERVNSAINSIIIHHSTVSAVFILVVVLISYVMSNRLVRPVRKLMEGIELIRKGKLSHKIEVEGEDEIGQLASAFNQMTGDLKASRSKLEDYSKNLEKQVTERTKELEGSRKELQENVRELERFNKLAVGRELKMVEMKKRVKELEGKARKR